MKGLITCKNHRWVETSIYDDPNWYLMSFSTEDCPECRAFCYNCWSSVKFTSGTKIKCQIVNGAISCFPCLSWRNNFTRLHWRNPISLAWLHLRRSGICHNLRKKILEYCFWVLKHDRSPFLIFGDW